jgi:hypothetical protein
MDKNLHVERWLLTLKTATAEAGLEAHVRALDFKGGKFLAFEVSQGDEALELRYEKRWAGAGQVAVATGAAITAQVRQVHERLLGQRRRLLQNGLRRFLRHSIGLLAALESALRNDAELPRRFEAALRELGGFSGARLAAVVRRRPGLFLKYEVLPALAIKEGTAIRFAGLSRGQLVDVSSLIKTQPSTPEEGRSPSQNTGFRTVQVAPELAVAAGVELVATTAVAAAGVAAAAAAVPPAPGQTTPAGAAQGQAAVVSDKRSALSDAACPGDCLSSINFGPSDCGALDWGNVDCGGAPDCSF